MSGSGVPAPVDQPPAGAPVIMLAPDPFGLGGIERWNRMLLAALAEQRGPDAVSLLTLRDRSHVTGDFHHVYRGVKPSGRRPEKVPARARLDFVLAALREARRQRQSRPLVLACHTHLAPVAWAAAKVAGAPYGVWCHGFEAWGRLRPSVGHGLRRADLVATHSSFGARAVEVAAGLRAGSVRVVAPGLPSELAVPPPRPEGCRVLTVARLEAANAYKGVDTLILAWPLVLAQAPGAELIVVGNGNDRQRLETMAETLGVDSRVRFLGRLSDGELGEAYASARLFALPGRHSVGLTAQGEGFGLVFIEAAAAGLPVVAGRGAGTDDAVAHEVSGLLVDPLDLSEVAGSIVRLLRDPELARRLGEGGKERAARLFSEQRFRRDVAGLLDELQSVDRMAAPAESSAR